MGKKISDSKMNAFYAIAILLCLLMSLFFWKSAHNKLETTVNKNHKELTEKITIAQLQAPPIIIEQPQENPDTVVVRETVTIANLHGALDEWAKNAIKIPDNTEALSQIKEAVTKLQEIEVPNNAKELTQLSESMDNLTTTLKKQTSSIDKYTSAVSKKYKQDEELKAMMSQIQRDIEFHSFD